MQFRTACINVGVLLAGMGLVIALPLVSPAADEGPAGGTFLGQPLKYWGDQALAESRQESVARIVQALSLAVDSDDPKAKVTAIDALQTLGPQAQAAAPVLVRALDESRAWIGVAAMDALAAIGKDAVPILVQTFEQGTAAARMRSALVLGNIGPDAAAALPVLQKAVANDAEPLRERLIGVIAQIKGQADATTVRTDAAAGPSAAPAALPGGEDDWPQFHGPQRDAICTETGLLTDWPQDGPPLLWKLEGLGKGFSTIAIADGKFYTMGDRKAADGTESQFALAYDLATRRELWAARVGPPHQDGPRCTPTIVAGRAYVLGTSGDLLCLDAATGKSIWHKNLPADFGGQMMSMWKFSESPLVDGHLYGGDGQNQGHPVCLKWATGEIAWKVRAPAKGSAAVLYADGHLIFRYDRGLVALLEATPEAYRLKASFTPPTADGPAWAHPVIHRGKLYLRHNDLLVCYDLRKSLSR